MVAARTRGAVAGLALLSYPLLEPMPPAKSSKATKADPAEGYSPNSVGVATSQPLQCAVPALLATDALQISCRLWGSCLGKKPGLGTL